MRAGCEALDGIGWGGLTLSKKQHVIYMNSPLASCLVLHCFSVLCGAARGLWSIAGLPAVPGRSSPLLFLAPLAHARPPPRFDVGALVAASAICTAADYPLPAPTQRTKRLWVLLVVAGEGQAVFFRFDELPLTKERGEWTVWGASSGGPLCVGQAVPVLIVRAELLASVVWYSNDSGGWGGEDGRCVLY